MNRLIEDLNLLGIQQVDIEKFPITWEEAVKRDTARLNGVGVSVLAEQFKKWHEIEKLEPEDYPKIKTVRHSYSHSRGGFGRGHCCAGATDRTRIRGGFLFPPQ
jgi:hypothetical protein